MAQQRESNGEAAAEADAKSPSESKPSGPGPDLAGWVAYLMYVALGGFLVFGFAWSIRGAVDTQTESICRALNPEHRNRIQGRVLDKGGQPVAGAEVVPLIEGKSGLPIKADEGGAFEVFLPEGSHAILARAPQKTALEMPITVARQESVEVEVRLAPEGQAEGSSSETGRAIFDAPDAVLQDLEGNEVRLSDFKGKFVVINFWATWCEPCITEWPQVDQLSGRLGEREDVVVLAVSIDTEKAAIGPFLVKMTLAEVVTDEQGNPIRDSEGNDEIALKTGVKVLWDPEQTFQKRFGTDKIPDTYFVDEDGRVLHTYVNTRKWGAPEAFHCVDGMIGRAG